MITFPTPTEDVFTSRHAAPSRLERVRLWSWWPSLVGGFLVWGASRALVSAIAMATLQIERGALLGGNPFRYLLFHWDAPHFAEIAEHGYFIGGDPSLPAFFPGYPALARIAAALLTPWGADAAILRGLAVVAGLGGIVAAVVVWRIAASWSGQRAGLAATALVFFGPYALFLHASYSESTFLAFATAAWYAGLRRHWLIAGILCAGAGFTRANGLFLLLALAVMYVVSRIREHRRLISWGIPSLLVGVLGTAAYFGYLYLRTGKLSEWSEAQQIGWGRAAQWPWQALHESVFLMTNHPLYSARIQSFFDIVFAALALIAVLWFAWRRSWPELVYVLITLASLTTSVSFVSLGRNTITLFPIPVALGRGSTRTITGAALWVGVFAVGVALLTFNTHQFVLGKWAD